LFETQDIEFCEEIINILDWHIADFPIKILNTCNWDFIYSVCTSRNINFKFIDHIKNGHIFHFSPKLIKKIFRLPENDHFTNECWILYMAIYLNHIFFFKSFTKKLLTPAYHECLYIANITDHSELSLYISEKIQKTPTYCFDDNYTIIRATCISVLVKFLMQIYYRSIL